MLDMSKIELRRNLDLLDQSLKTLHYSLERVKNIDFEKKLNSEKMESLEALTARFARTSDILTQKVFKSLFMILQEDLTSFIDKGNFLEKLSIVKDADDIFTIRALRNSVAHEYSTIDLKDIFLETIKYIPTLMEIIDNTKNYIKTKKML